MISAQARVPTEILGEVFHLLHNPDVPIRLDELGNISGLHFFPWAVGQVCRRWRNAFISHPHLWTSLALRWHFDRDRSAAYIAETNRRTAIYVERSGRLPLTISISLSGTKERRPSEAIKTLVSCSKRWKLLDICIDAESDMELLKCKGNLPNLTTLMMTGDVALNPRLSSIFEVTPRLTYFHVSRRIGKIALPWAQLTRFRILIRWEHYCEYGDELWPAVLQLQNVETLELLGVPNFPSFGAAPPRFPVQLPRLLSLETTLGYCEMFSWFVAPSLEHLRIDDRHDSWDEHATHRIWNGVFSLINRSSCCVRRLTLRQCTFGAAPEMLEAFASVEELIIERPTKTFPTLLRYIAGFNDKIYLPKLRVLEMRYCPGHNIEELVATMSHFLEERGKGSRLAPTSCVPLERLVIQLEWCSWCPCYRKSADIPWKALEAIRSLPSDANINICLHDSKVKRWDPRPPPWSDLDFPYV